MFALKNMGTPKYYLGIKMQYQSSGSMLLTQINYIKYILSKINMVDVNGVNTRMFIYCKLSKYGTDTMLDPSLYGSKVGAQQQYTLMRPNIII